MQFLYCFQLQTVHNSPCVRHNFVELVEILLLKQEHHVVRQNECVSRTHVNCLFECHFCVVYIGSALQCQGQVAKSFFIIRLDFKRIKEVDRSLVKVLVLFILDTAYVDDGRYICGVVLPRSLEHL